MAERGKSVVIPSRPSLTNPVSQFAYQVRVIDANVRAGRFQRLLALTAGTSSLLAGIEVAYFHYFGSYSRRVMYTPVLSSMALFGAGVSAARSERAAKTVLPGVSAVTLANSLVGAYFHVRGVARKPGGWKLPLTNIVLGPPILAPFLFGIPAYLGLIASRLDREGEHPSGSDWNDCERRGVQTLVGSSEPTPPSGAITRNLALATAITAGATGFEAFYSHYKSAFRRKAQWAPVITAPVLAAAGLASLRVPGVKRTMLPAIAGTAILVGLTGSAFHAREVLRRPGGRKLLAYNILRGPPISAPLLVSSAGLMGLMASWIGRPRRTEERLGVVVAAG